MSLIEPKQTPDDPMSVTTTSVPTTPADKLTPSSLLVTPQPGRGRRIDGSRKAPASVLSLSLFVIHDVETLQVSCDDKPLDYNQLAVHTYGNVEEAWITEGAIDYIFTLTYSLQLPLFDICSATVLPYLPLATGWLITQMHTDNISHSSYSIQGDLILHISTCESSDLPQWMEQAGASTKRFAVKPHHSSILKHVLRDLHLIRTSDEYR